MRKDTIFPASLVSAIALALSACGGSSSSDPAAPVQPAVSAPPPPAAEKVTLRGVVTDAPITNATVTVTVDGQTFTALAPTDANGAYEVEVESENDDALITVDAVQSDTGVRFTAIVDTFGALDAAADSDDAVADINVTNVTTAQAVLATRLTDDGSIDSAEELTDAVSRVDTEGLLELSAAIKVVVENIDGVALPTDAQDTLDLAESIADGESTFLADVAVSAPEALATAVDLVLTDGNATVPFEADAVPGVYVPEDGQTLIAMLPQQFGFMVSYEDDGIEAFDWTVDSAGILNLFIGGDNPRTEAVTLLDRTNDVVNVVVREDGDEGEGDASTAFFASFDAGFTEQSVPGTYSSLDDPRSLTVFLNDGTGYNLDLVTGTQDDAFTWTVDQTGVLRLVDDIGGAITNARSLTGSDDQNLRLLVWDLDPNGALDYAAVIDVLRTESVAIDSVSPDGVALLLAGNTYAVTESDEIGLFTFGADGTLLQINQQFEDEGIDLDTKDGTWVIDANGSIEITFPLNDGTGAVEVDTAQVLQGLGEDFMVIQTENEENPLLQVTRVVALDTIDRMIGTFNITNELTGEALGQVTLLPDFTGSSLTSDGNLEPFEWGVTSDGLIVVEPTLDDFDTETVTLNLLAGDGGDLLRFVAVNRKNGLLRQPTADGAETDVALEVISLLRLP